MDLNGKRILVTRPRLQSAEFEVSLREVGARPVSFPVIEIAPLNDTTLLDRALRNLPSYDWLILTSANGVSSVWQRLADLGIQGIPPSVKVAAIGPVTTSALEKQGVQPDFVPDEYVAEAILPGLGEVRGCRILLLRADIARPALAKAIEQAGGIADEVAAYRTLPAQVDPDGLQALQAGVDIITFTSSSTVRNFMALVQGHGLDAHHLTGEPLFACIGPITAQTAKEYDLPVGVIADEYTTAGLIQALQNYER